MPQQRVTPKTLERQDRKAGFEEVVQELTLPQAVAEANRCLYCFDAPCIQGCPAGVNVPEFITRIRTRNLLGAAEVVYAANPLGSICGRVCPTEALCEKACTSRLLNSPIAIGHLQRFVCDLALGSGKVHFEDIPAGQGKVAVIGGGPAGLACAHELCRRGYTVHLYEREPELGGLLRWGIPLYRLPKEIADLEINLIRDRIQIFRTAVVGAFPAQVMAAYDAVFLGIGLALPVRMDIPGEELAGVYSANEMLRAIREGNAPVFDCSRREVAVVGAGAAAMDAARCSIRLGAERVTVLYRRTQDQMPAFQSEYQSALEEGVQFRWLVSPAKVEEANGKLQITLEEMRLGETDSSGRARPVPSGRFFQLEVDILFVAISSKSEPESLEGWEKSGPDAAPCPKVFRGGDLTGGATVVEAIAGGRKAAEDIDSWLRKESAQ